ncbi:MAG: AIR synthase family protein, partial [Candidatus Geothermarchaeota archaeon]
MKLKPYILANYVINRIGVLDPNVLIGPSIGEDAAAIDLGGDRILVIHVDPISGAVEYVGWLAVHIACNDIAVTGARPKWLLSVLYLPEGVSLEIIDTITQQIDSAAKEVNAMIVGGHTEYTPGINRPLISMTAAGLATKTSFVRTGGAKEGDYIIMTKTAGVEGTSILASDFSDILVDKGVPSSIIELSRNFIKRISVIKEALALSENGLVNSMHDPTEGGLIGGLTEIAYASNKTIEVWEDKVPVATETRTICSALKIDPLKLISSGVLLASVSENKLKEAIKIINSIGINVAIIGRV